MKTPIKALILLTLITTNAKAFDLSDLVTPKVQRIALPCAVGLVAGGLLNQPEAGIVACAAGAAFVMVDDYHNPGREQVKEDVSRFLHEAKELSESRHKSNKHDYEAYQEAIRRIVLEKLSEVQSASNAQIEEYMKSPEFDKFLKEKTAQALKGTDDVVSDKLQKLKEEIRREVTESVLRDVVESGIQQ